MIKGSSLSTRWLGFQTLGYGLIFSIVLVFQYFYIRNDVYAEIEKSGKTLLSFFVETIASDPGLLTEKNLDPIINAISYKVPGIAQITVVDVSLKVIDDTGDTLEGSISDKTTFIEVISHAKENRLFYTRGNYSFLRVSAPIFGPYDSVRKSNVIGAVSIDFDLSATRGRIFTSFANIGIFFLALLLIFLTLQFVLLKTELLTPLMQLSRAAKSIGRGILDVPVVINSNNEIGMLAAHMEQMRWDLIEEIGRCTQIENSLLESNQTIRTVIQTSPLAIVNLDVSGIVRLWNPAAEKIFGWSESEVIGRMLPAIPKEKQDESQKLFHQVSQGESIINFETKGNCKNGSLVDISLSLSHIHDKDGDIKGFMAIVADISERKKQEKELIQAKAAAEKADLAKSAFLAAMSHEIRTPLNGVIGMAGVLLQTDLAPQQRRFAEMIRFSGGNLLSVVNDILDFSNEALMTEPLTENGTLIRMEAKILVAEDNLVNQQVVLCMLEAAGYQVDMVADGKEAIKALENIEYDAVLMDLQMPEMDGLEAVRHIRNPQSSIRNHDIPVIALTAHSLRGEKETCISAGMNDYLSKPVDPDKLYAMLRQWIPQAVRIKAAAKVESPAAAIPGAIREEPPIDRQVLAVLKKLQPGDQPDILPRLIHLFVSETSSRLMEMQGDLAKGNRGTLARIAHTIKGSSANMGAKKLSRLCSDLEKNVGTEEMDKLRDLLGQVEVEFARVRAALEHETTL